MRVSDFIGPDPTTEPAEVVVPWYEKHPTDTKLLRVCRGGFFFFLGVLAVCALAIALRNPIADNPSVSTPARVSLENTK